MPTITVFRVQNDNGQDLLDNYLRPTCTRIGARLKEAPANANRGHAMVSQSTSDLVLWDCSVENQGLVYDALTVWVKTTKKHVIVSRTPLPRNVLTHYQCAPVHGAQFSNEVLGEWLDKQLPMILHGKYSSETYQHGNLASHYWMFEKPASLFLSFRGTHEKKAQLWKQSFEGEHRMDVRMVPPNEYAYPTECVTYQQMWESVARLMHEMRATQRVAIFWSDDYFDSFWTASEFLTTLWMLERGRETGKTMLDEAFFVRDPSSLHVQPFRDGLTDLAVQLPDQAGMKRFAKLINNSDPITSAPETQVSPHGAAKLIAWLLRRRMGFYDPDFMASTFWHTVRVPCPICKPDRRSPREVDWHRHMMLLDDSPTVDYFGYFPVEPQTLETGTATCPRCSTTLHLENKRGIRTLWVPVQTTEPDKSRPALQTHKVWEVIKPTTQR